MGIAAAYPWRWTTPLALFVLLTSTALLTCVNIPLSAYETVQESTYFPNATLPALLMSNIIPPFLRAPTATFSPQTLHVGDTFRLKNSVFSYTIVSAFDAVDNKTPVASFPYYNNPYDSCDVSVELPVHSSLPDYLQAFVTCTRPTIFQMALNWDESDDTSGDLLLPLLDQFGQDMSLILYSRVLGANDVPYGSGTIKVTVRPCCNCTGNMTDAAESASLLEPPCSTEPVRFIGLTVSVRNSTDISDPWGAVYDWNGSNITDLFAGLDPGHRLGYIGSHDLSALNTPFLNLFQIFHHLVRRDLGNILENQNFSSPDMFDRSINTVALSKQVAWAGSPFSNITSTAANAMRAATANETLMAQWHNSILAINKTDRVPVLEYLRAVPRLKPLGSAITSVFVSTFAMVSTVWTIFSIVARVFVRSTNDDSDSATLRETFYEAYHTNSPCNSAQDSEDASSVYNRLR
ncbi:hypothetical protein GGX14DRAFT_593794 [Mycena pura]|uniref:Transmembrane protein n=1 Tax=Mycena pura TaxID=153505 RepID=A0AAD6UUQ4_9AGAR|nr:hypothetical protein GGX14DRAFT_593794 [Mycena pura]